jgi:uncharacterized protein (TIRG00374 family)
MPTLGRRALLTLVVGVPVSAALLWLAVRDADLGTVWDTLRRASLADVAFAVGAIAVVYALQAARWKRIANTPSVPLGRFLELVVTGVACNNVLPARLGDLLRARWLAREAHISAGRGLAGVVLDRACDVAALLVLLLVGLAAVASADWLVTIALGAAALLVVVGAGLFLARVYIGRRARERRERGLLRRVARDAIEGLAEPIGRRRLASCLVLSLAAWIVWAGAAELVAHALDVDLGLLDAVFVAAVVNLGVAIPSSPGFVGTYEWLGVASLRLLDVNADDALAFSILLHAAWYVPTTVVGGTALAVRAAERVRRGRAVPRVS